MAGSESAEGMKRLIEKLLSVIPALEGIRRKDPLGFRFLPSAWALSDALFRHQVFNKQKIQLMININGTFARHQENFDLAL